MDSSILTKLRIDLLLWYKYFMQLHNCGHTSVGSANIRCTWLMCLLLLSTKKLLTIRKYHWLLKSNLTKRFCWMNLFSHFGILEKTKRPLIFPTLLALGIEIGTDSFFFLIHFHFRTMNNAWKGICICFKAILSLLSWKESKKVFKMVTK